jgi:hypothetical protein
LASFAGKGGFAADLGRFGETTLPFFSMGADALPPLKAAEVQRHQNDFAARQNPTAFGLLE